MKVFLSWSGSRSKAVADALGAWLAQVIQSIEPWISSEIEKGTRWQPEMTDLLEEAKIGIVCLTSTNLEEPWILFEAGALSKIKGSYVCTFLLDITPAEVKAPLGQFQHTVFSKEDVLKLLNSINSAVKKNGERPLTDENLKGVFDVFWPRLETALTEIKNRDDEKPAKRTERDMIEEILDMLRAQEQRREAESKKRIARLTSSVPLTSIGPAPSGFSWENVPVPSTWVAVPHHGPTGPNVQWTNPPPAPLSPTGPSGE